MNDIMQLKLSTAKNNRVGFLVLEKKVLRELAKSRSANKSLVHLLTAEGKEWCGGGKLREHERERRGKVNSRVHSTFLRLAFSHSLRDFSSPSFGRMRNELKFIMLCFFFCFHPQRGAFLSDEEVSPLKA